MKRLLAGLALSLAAAIASAQNAAPWIFVSDAWVFVNGGNVQAAGYLTVQDEGTALPQEPILNCVGANITCTDDAAHTRTLLTITGGGGGSVATDAIWTAAGQIAYATGNAAATVLNGATGVLHSTGASAPSWSTVATGDIAASAVTYGKVQNETNATLLGNSSGGAAAPAEQTITAPMTLSGGALSVAVTPTNPGGAVASQATTPGTQQGSSGSSNINTNGTWIEELDNLQVTTVNGVTVQNTTAATSGVLSQYPPSYAMCGQEWNTGGTPATNTDCVRWEPVFASGNPTTAGFKFTQSLNGGAYTNLFTVSSGGTATFTGGGSFSANVSVSGAANIFNQSATANGTGGFSQTGTNGAVSLITSNHLVSASCTSGTTCDSTTNIPANAVILAVGYRITTAVTGATTIELGTAANATGFCTGLTTLTVNTTGVCGGGNTGATGTSNSSAAALRITATAGTFTAGVIEYQITYIVVTPPTS